MCRFFTCLLLFPSIAFAITDKDLKDAYSYAYGMSVEMTDADFRQVIRFEEANIEWNRVTTPLVRDLVDKNVDASTWVNRSTLILGEAGQAAKRGNEAWMAIDNADLRMRLRRIQSGNIQILMAYNDIKIAFANADKLMADRALSALKEASDFKRAEILPIVKRLREKLGDEIVDKSLESIVAKVSRDLQPLTTVRTSEDLEHIPVINVPLKGTQDPEIIQLKRKAKDGDGNSAWLLGVYYYEGIGVPQDYSEAVKWFSISADAGNPMGISALADAFAEGKGIKFDPSEATRLYKLAVTKAKTPVELSMVAYRTALWFHEGPVAYRDHDEALRFYEVAGRLGNPGAYKKLGRMMLNGEGCATDLTRATYYFKKGADIGDEDSMYESGMSYYTGRGVPLDYSQAFDYLCRAAARNHPASIYNLAEMYRYGQGTRLDLPTARDLMKRAAELGVWPSQMQYGIMLVNGSGGTKEMVVGGAWLMLAAESGDLAKSALSEYLKVANAQQIRNARAMSESLRVEVERNMKSK